MIDISKYGTPVDEAKGFYNKTDVSKYGTPTTTDNIATTPQGVSGLKGVGVGIAKRGLQTIKDLGQLGEKALGATGLKKLVNAPDTYTEQAIQANKDKGGAFGKLFAQSNLNRYGTAEKVGGTIEQLAELAIPIGKIKKSVKTANTVQYLANTPETITKVEEKVASLANRVKTTITGKKIILPSETEKRAAQILSGKISSNPVKNPIVISKEIAKRGNEVEQYLAKNPIKITAQQQSDMLTKARDSVSKYLDKNQLKALDEQWKMFTKLIPGKGGFTTENFYKALKEYEDNVASNLARGKSALLDPSGVASAKIQGAKMVRSIVRDTIGNLHPEFKGKMFDLASLYDVLDTALTKSRQLTGSSLLRFAKNNPTLTNIAKVGAGIGIGKTLLGGKKEPTLGNLNQIGNE